MTISEKDFSEWAVRFVDHKMKDVLSVLYYKSSFLELVEKFICSKLGTTLETPLVLNFLTKKYSECVATHLAKLNNETMSILIDSVFLYDMDEEQTIIKLRTSKNSFESAEMLDFFLGNLEEYISCNKLSYFCSVFLEVPRDKAFEFITQVWKQKGLEEGNRIVVRTGEKKMDLHLKKVEMKENSPEWKIEVEIEEEILSSSKFFVYLSKSTLVKLSDTSCFLEILNTFKEKVDEKERENRIEEGNEYLRYVKELLEKNN